MMFDLWSAIARDRATKAQAQYNRAMIRAQMAARVALAWEIYGDAFAGFDAQGNVVLWRKSPIPTVPRKVRP